MPVTKLPAIDFLIARLYRARHFKIADALLWQVKGPAHSSLIQWVDNTGMVWMLNPHISLDRALLVHGRHDPEIMDLLAEQTTCSDVLWDIGANIGCLSLPLLRRFPGLEVVAFEPSPAAAHQFLLNASINNLRARLVTTPLADCLRAENLFVKLTRNSGQNSMRPWQNVQYDAQVSVLCESADHLRQLADLPPPNVIKLDVEQFELEVFQGMRGILSGQSVRFITFECMKNSNPQRFEAICELLSHYGFSVSEISPPPGKPVENFFAKRR